MNSGGYAFSLFRDWWSPADPESASNDNVTFIRRPKKELERTQFDWQRFFQQGNESPENTPFFGVVIKKYHDDEFHCGVIGKPPDSSDATVLHFTASLNYTTASTADWGISVFFPNGAKPHPAIISAFCNRMREIANADANNSIPYSYTLKSTINDSGLFVEGDTEAPGFTCATFVLAVFKSANDEFVLLDESTWEVREEDEQWQRHVCQLIEDYFDDKGQEELRESIGDVVRFRPSEVNAAALSNTHPVTFEAVQSAASHIRNCLSDGGS